MASSTDSATIDYYNLQETWLWEESAADFF